jgi:hypothetical protein
MTKSPTQTSPAPPTIILSRPYRHARPPMYTVELTPFGVRVRVARSPDGSDGDSPSISLLTQS